ncbi:MAG: MAPEG family protein [Pseudomonadota bacterium]
MPIELTMVALASVLLVVHLIMAAGTRTMSFGLSWAAGPRDTVPGEVPERAKRLDRAARNMQETFPVFVALAIGVVVGEVTSVLTALGSVLYVLARVVYLPAYVFHVQFVRSLLWVAAMLGLVMLGLPLLFGGLL